MRDGWVETELGNVASYVNGRAFKPTEWEEAGLPIIRIQNLNRPEIKYNYSTGDFEEKFLVKKGDLLFA
jgi:type I restriction enzyme, S subunit